MAVNASGIIKINGVDLSGIVQKSVNIDGGDIMSEEWVKNYLQNAVGTYEDGHGIKRRTVTQLPADSDAPETLSIKGTF